MMAIGDFVVSVSGHDKSNVYVVYGISPERLQLVDGRAHTTDRPKQKNYRHVRQLQTNDPSLTEKLRGDQSISDVDIRRSIKKVVTELGNQEGGKTLV